MSVPSWCPQRWTAWQKVMGSGHGKQVVNVYLEWKGGQFHHARFEVFEVITPDADNELHDVYYVVAM